MRSKLVPVALAAALLVCAFARAAVDIHLAIAAPVPTSATLKTTCMSDGTMRIESDARPGTP